MLNPRCSTTAIGATLVHHTLSTSLSALYDLGFALFHLTFWRWFKWPQSLERSGRLNQGITQTLNVMLSYVFVVYAASLALAAIQSQGPLALAGSGFWLLRAIAQPVLFARTRSSWILVAVFALGAGLHAISYVDSTKAGVDALSSAKPLS
ncbi:MULTISPECIES: hypothetical protein [Burkholderia]|jgi:hypothetical protein|uniref:hypothetical protein n=1 Tax=Burkholderia TaxID=32008 RepID=UPI001CF3F22E|nr:MULTISPECIES: hypothetical protein [Burkholderia]MCA3777473.1 hypothetical protein [Burkholderia sp.]MCA3854306.1 hypothetical protein [Burkholderia sp.]MCA3875606.1 hypothetical protein [Burkholderia sp.]MCA8046087.1 hypothetical protein [Burkholderia arboris]